MYCNEMPYKGPHFNQQQYFVPASDQILIVNICFKSQCRYRQWSSFLCAWEKSQPHKRTTKPTAGRRLIKQKLQSAVVVSSLPVMIHTHELAYSDFSLKASVYLKQPPRMHMHTIIEYIRTQLHVTSGTRLTNGGRISQSRPEGARCQVCALDFRCRFLLGLDFTLIFFHTASWCHVCSTV